MSEMKSIVSFTISYTTGIGNKKCIKIIFSNFSDKKIMDTLTFTDFFDKMKLIEDKGEAVCRILGFQD